MNADNNHGSKEKKDKNRKDKKSGKNGRTRISAKIEKIEKNAEAEMARIHEKDVETNENTDSERDFELKLNIKELKGTISLADVIKKKSRGG